MFNPNDYAGDTNAAAYREYNEELEQLHLERKEREEREILECEAADRENAAWLALNSWKAAVTAAPRVNALNSAFFRPAPRYAEIANGIFVRVGNPRKRRAA